ncbi:TBC13 protein, partial [Polypterus senegalus]
MQHPLAAPTEPDKAALWDTISQHALRVSAQVALPPSMLGEYVILPRCLLLSFHPTVFMVGIQEFNLALSESKIDLKILRELCFGGIPFEGGLRSLCWKCHPWTPAGLHYWTTISGIPCWCPSSYQYLGLLPPSSVQEEAISRHYCPPLSFHVVGVLSRELYAQFLKEMIIQPGIAKANLGLSREDVTLEDHPLNPNPDSRWNTYFKDNEVLLQIDKDVRRLYPDMAFFQRPTEYPCRLILDPQNEYETLRKRVEQTTLKAQTVAKNRSGVTNVSSPAKTQSSYPSNEYEVLPNGCEAHWEVVERILFIYAKLNPGIAYVQGMNEIVGPIYYTFATDPNNEWKEHAEADTFFCFTNLMSENRDNFIKSLDDSQCGITSKMESVYSTLKEKDMELYLRLQEQNIKPQYFTFRWLTLLLSQEFLLPDVIRIWDSLFSDQDRFNFLLLVCCAMLVLIRDEILVGDFTVNMRLLQDNKELLDLVDLQHTLQDRS